MGDFSDDAGALFRIMAWINFGWIEQLHVRDGQPTMDPPPRIIRKCKFGGQNEPRPEAEMPEFTLKKEHREFLRELSKVRSGVVRCIDVCHGLPCGMEVEEPGRA